MSERAGLRSTLVATAKRLGGSAMTVKARCLIRGYDVPRWGNLRRTIPFSASYGFERGQPVDRYYLHRFLNANRDVITGDVLEVQSSELHGALRPSPDAKRFVRHRARGSTRPISATSPTAPA